jgi:rhodanese-related sulfurtransferase
VAYYLRTQGFDACNLTGGITQWCVQGGEVEVRTTL